MIRYRQALLLRRGQPGAAEQIQAADDGVQRGADLMADHGYERGLGLVGRLSRLACGFQRWRPAPCAR